MSSYSQQPPHSWTDIHQKFEHCNLQIAATTSSYMQMYVILKNQDQLRKPLRHLRT